MFTYFETYYANGTPNMEKAGTFKDQCDAIKAAKIYHKSIVFQIDKVVLNYSDGWTDCNVIFEKDGDKTTEYIYE